MTNEEERPDVTARRHVNRLRKELGLTGVPPLIGVGLKTITAGVAAQIEEQLRNDAPSHDPLAGPDGRSLRPVIATRTLEEFTRIIAGRPLVTPTVSTILGRSARLAEDPERWRQALLSTYQVLRDAVRPSWASLPEARPYTELLHTALTRYLNLLCASAKNALPLTRPHASPPSEDARSTLVAIVEHRWGGQSAQLCLRISAVPPNDATTATSVTARTARPGRHDAAPALRLEISDHLVIVAQHPVPTRRSRGAAAQPEAVWVGPVAATDVALAYDAALLLYRLVGAGVAVPPPSPVPLPDFGILRLSPTTASVEKISDLLQPLTSQRSIHRRVTLAQTLQLRLRTTDTSQSLAEQLGVHAHTVSNHLGALRELYDSPDLDFGRDTLAIRAALDLVLPLWEQEEAAGRPAHARRGSLDEEEPLYLA